MTSQVISKLSIGELERLLCEYLDIPFEHYAETQDKLIALLERLEFSYTISYANSFHPNTGERTLKVTCQVEKPFFMDAPSSGPFFVAIEETTIGLLRAWFYLLYKHERIMVLPEYQRLIGKVSVLKDA